MKKTYYIFRHSETFVTQSKSRIRFYGFKIFSAHILPIGLPVTEKLARYLINISTEKNLCSEYIRCKETAEIVTRITGKTFTYDKRLNEYFLESAGRFRRRLENFIAEMEASDDKKILICTHGLVIVALIKILCGEQFTFSHLFEINPSPGVLTIVKNGKVKTIDFNDPSS